MNWSSFKYLVKQGWHNMVANRLMTVASLGVLTACLVITGIAGILSVSVSNFVQSLGDKDMIEVFISDEATDEQIEAWSQQLPQLANVASCTFISKAQAVEDMKAEMGEYADVLQDYEGEGNEANPLPASFRIYVTDIAHWDQINRVYADYFGPHRPARIVVPAASLHFGCLVEIEAVAEVRK